MKGRVCEACNELSDVLEHTCYIPQHSPLPWHKEYRGNEIWVMPAGACLGSKGVSEDERNADLIVLAVNALGDLVEVLENVRPFCLGNKTLLEMVDEAIAKGKGK